MGQALGLPSRPSMSASVARHAATSLRPCGCRSASANCACASISLITAGMSPSSNTADSRHSWPASSRSPVASASRIARRRPRAAPPHDRVPRWRCGARRGRRPTPQIACSASEGNGLLAERRATIPRAREVECPPGRQHSGAKGPVGLGEGAERLLEEEDRRVLDAGAAARWGEGRLRSRGPRGPGVGDPPVVAPRRRPAGTSPSLDAGRRRGAGPRRASPGVRTDGGDPSASSGRALLASGRRLLPRRRPAAAPCLARRQSAIVFSRSANVPARR